jgi:PEP-CTERM motif
MKLLATAAAALLLSLPLAAHAGATANAHLNGFRYELIDLDLNDGIAAQLTLEGTGLSVMAGYYAAPDNTTLPDPFHYLDTEGTVGVTVAAGSATGTLTATSANASAALPGAHGAVFAQTLWGSNFTLTPNSRLVLHANAHIDGSEDADHASVSFASVFFEFGEENFYLGDGIGSYDGGTASRALTVALSSDREELSGNFGFTTSAFAAVTAVPEPSSYAMLGMGLAGMAWRARRKAK